MTVGSGHSPLDLTMTTQWLCNLDKFNQILNKEEFYGEKNIASSLDSSDSSASASASPCSDSGSVSDKGAKLNSNSSQEVKFVDLTVQAGCRVYELNNYVKKHNLAVQNLGSISDQSIAGLISTGTHGSTQYHGLVSQQVVEIILVNSAGKLITCSSIKNPEIFKAALLSLGKIGIIVQIKLRTCPSYTIKSKQEMITFNTLLNNWSNIWLDSEFIRIWWFPYTDKCVLWRASKSSDPLSDPRPSWYGTKFGRFFYQSLLWISVHLLPSITPWIEKFVFNQQYGNVETLGNGDIAVQHSVDGLNMDCLFSQFVNEWSAPLNKGEDILLKLKSEILNAANSNSFYVHAPIEVRCSNVTNTNTPFIDDDTGKESIYPSKSWLANRNQYSSGPIPGNNFRPYLDNSPNLEYSEKITNDQLTLFINATMYRPFGTNVKTHQWFQIFENIMSEAGGKPHWAKNFIGLDGPQKTKQDLDLQKSYGGKEFYSMIGFQPVMKDWFGENLIKFNKIRKELDPAGVFLSGKDWADRNGILID